ncbi:hypothetical protein Psi01_11350 [Planobispora siamensis]|uniref:Uncharacterized protein n=1 Tax=Planobispora siamensis TaxID=936338 RepID=A0A8J3SDF5_9ACTN|nr:hypothetical protein Psi01_11350 [Planobispora siamensis]
MALREVIGGLLDGLRPETMPHPGVHRAVNPVSRPRPGARSAGVTARRKQGSPISSAFDNMIERKVKVHLARVEEQGDPPAMTERRGGLRHLGMTSLWCDVTTDGSLSFSHL